MLVRVCSLLLSLLALPHGCLDASPPVERQLEFKAAGTSPELLAVYEAWFGHPRHISVGYSSHDPAVIKHQMQEAAAMGISGFVVDWYGDREPFIDSSYALMQATAAKQHFHIAMMYDETDQEDSATDEAMADFTMFHETYLSPKAPGSQAYLTYQGRPVIFIFPKGGHTDWNRIRAMVSEWSIPPLLIQENLPGADAAAFDGFYPWINPGQKGWTADGSSWGEDYLNNFYQTMKSKYPGKIIVGGAWAGFDDSKASWGLNRHIAARCGQTFRDTFAIWRNDFAADNLLPFVLIETWNDHEEGTAIEDGIPSCGPAVKGRLLDLPPVQSATPGDKS